MKFENCYANKFKKNTTSIHFSLLQVCPSMTPFLFAVLFIPSGNVFSSFFYVSLSMVAFPNV